MHQTTTCCPWKRPKGLSIGNGGTLLLELSAIESAKYGTPDPARVSPCREPSPAYQLGFRRASDAVCQRFALTRWLINRFKRRPANDLPPVAANIVPWAKSGARAGQDRPRERARTDWHHTKPSPDPHLLARARDVWLDLVAVGVETLAQQHYLAEVGCPYAQGFGYARPMSVEALQVCLSASTSSLN
jgi:hypothetical protein